MANYLPVLFILLLLNGIGYILANYLTTSIKSKSGEGCEYTKYEGGNGTVNIEPIVTVQAAVPSCAIVEALGRPSATLVKNSPHVANAMMHATNAIKGFTGNLAELAPKLAPILGLLGVGLGFMNQLMQVTPTQIIAATNNAFRELIRQVNHRFNQLADYVDQQDLNLHKEIINDVFKGDQSRWVRSVEYQSRELVDEQQRLAESNMYAHRHFYMNEEKFESNEELSAREVQTLEMQLVSLKKHADLHLLALASLIETYKDGQSTGGLNQWRQYKRHFVTYGREYVDYTEWAYNQIYKYRVQNQDLPFQSYTCEDPEREIDFGVSIHPFLRRSSQKCSFTCNTFKRPKMCDVSASLQCKYICDLRTYFDVQPLRNAIQNEARKICRTYIGKLRSDVVNFWKNEILNVSMPAWKEAIRLQENDLNNEEATVTRNDIVGPQPSFEKEKEELERKLTEGLPKHMSMNKYLERLLEKYKSLKAATNEHENDGEASSPNENEGENESKTDGDAKNENEK